MFWQFIINGLISGVLYALFAIGFALVYNTTRIFHIAAAGIYVVAAYLFYTFTILVGLNLVISATLAIVSTALISLGIDYAVYRPLKRRGASLNVNLIASIGVMIVLVNLSAILWGNDAQVFNKVRVSEISFGSIYLTQTNLWQLTIGTIVLVMWIFIEKGNIGLRLRALSTNRELYSVLGHDEKRIRIIVFLLSGIFICIASCLTAFEVGMTPQVGMNSLITALVAMILGGIGRYHTCVYGGLLLGVLKSVATMWMEASWTNAAVFIILLLLLFIRPQGIAGLKQRTV